MMTMETKNIKFIIKRWDPKDKKWFRKEYEVPVYKGMTIVDALYYIKEKLDRTLSFRVSCRMGLCGSCGMVINGKPRLACETQVLHLNSDRVYLEPLYNFPPIKDLATDLGGFFNKQRTIKPYLIRHDIIEQAYPTREYSQSMEEWNNYIQFAQCITCGLCYAACPTTATNPDYLGPQALTNLYRYIADSRDEGTIERIRIADDENGVWGCHLATGCSEVCPKGVDPALAIQLLRKEVLKSYLGLFKEKKRIEIVPPLPSPEKSEYRAFGTPPKFTVEGAEDKIKEFKLIHPVPVKQPPQK